MLADIFVLDSWPSAANNNNNNNNKIIPSRVARLIQLSAKQVFPVKQSHTQSKEAS